MTVAKSGSVAGAQGKQHVDLYRKLLLRRELLPHAPPGAVYAPYIGDGDLAAELYAGRLILGADLDPERVATASSRLPGADLRVADCEGPYPFADRAEPVAIADLDAYSNPYLALVAFWSTAPKAEPVVIFGTDGMRLAIRRSKSRVLAPLPAGVPLLTVDINTRRRQWNGWPEATVLPFIREVVAPWTVDGWTKYLRDHMLYWCVLVEPPRVAKSRAPGWRKPGQTKRQTSAHYRAQVAKRVKKRAAKLRPLSNGRKRSSIDARLAAAGPATPQGADLATPPPDEDSPVAKVEAALKEAALSGNVPAALAWLEANAPERWGERQTARMSPAERGAALGYELDE